ncbi:MAG: hypothetical protein NT090_17465, partial [Acidobacteria bacterium]|nr:hypothetical protein [Acidobacteriota bacterium]
MRWLILAILVLSVASAKDKPTYPDHGALVAMRTERATSGGGVYTDSRGKTHGGAVSSHPVPIFKIRTPNIDYEVEGRPDLSIGEELNFRIDKLRRSGGTAFRPRHQSITPAGNAPT